MANCGYCGSSIFFGGASSAGQRFCNRKCLTNAQVLHAAHTLPADLIEREVETIFRGNCPKCHGLGPIEVHKVHRVWSAVALTRWTTSSQLSCRSCATKSQLGGVLFSALLGWWGFPWGLILTPVQIGRNIAGMWPKSDASRPSADLRKLVMVNLVRQASRKLARHTPPPVPA